MEFETRKETNKEVFFTLIVMMWTGRRFIYYLL
jgi:hypothetical protein